MAGNNTTKPGDTTNTAPTDEECVSRLELRDMMRAMTEAFSKYQDVTALSFERLDRRVSGLVDRMDTMEARLPQATATAPKLPLLLITMTRLMMPSLILRHRYDDASIVIDKVWEVIIDVDLNILITIMIRMLRSSFRFHRSMALMMQKPT